MKKTMIAALALLAPLSVRAQGAPAASPDVRTVTVTATATVSRAPDQATVVVAVESVNAVAQAAAQENARKMDALMRTLRGAGIAPAQIRTVSYSLDPEYDYQQPSPRGGAPQPPRIRGYHATNMVQVTVDSVAKVGSILDAVVSSGANRVAGINFQLRDPESARLDALRQAMSDARREAEALADASGNRLGALLDVNTTGYVRPMVMQRMSMARADVAGAPPPAPPTPVEPGQLDVQASVTAVFRLDPR